ncbi:MAG: hypothetical protein JOZ84_03840 [Methylobacteriaceae bacterium]|nr:hypothetical protein [Methylobacteriaceae bacterium]
MLAALAQIAGNTPNAGPQGTGSFVAGKLEGSGNPMVAGKPEATGNPVSGQSAGTTSKMDKMEKK